jgi:hypothetical protein
MTIIYFHGQTWLVFPALVGLASGVSAFFLGLEWLLIDLVETHRKHKEAEAITPTYMAAQAVRFLSAEALAVIPHWEHMLRVGHLMGPAGASDFLITDTAVIPYNFISDFLGRSSFTRLDKIGNYSDKTQGREYAQALTDELCKRGYALPANGREPALWLTGDSRARFAEEMGIELEKAI